MSQFATTHLQTQPKSTANITRSPRTHALQPLRSKNSPTKPKTKGNALETPQNHHYDEKHKEILLDERKECFGQGRVVQQSGINMVDNICNIQSIMDDKQLIITKKDECIQQNVQQGSTGSHAYQNRQDMIEENMVDNGHAYQSDRYNNHNRQDNIMPVYHYPFQHQPYSPYYHFYPPLPPPLPLPPLPISSTTPQIIKQHPRHLQSRTLVQNSKNMVDCVSSVEDSNESNEFLQYQHEEDIQKGKQMPAEMPLIQAPYYPYYPGYRSMYEEHQQMQRRAERAYWQEMKAREKRQDLIGDLYMELKRNIKDFNRQQTVEILQAVKCVLKFKEQKSRGRDANMVWVATVGYQGSLKRIKGWLQGNNRNIREFMRGLLQAMQMKEVVLQINSAKIELTMKRENNSSQTKRLLDLLVRDPQKMIC